MQNSLAEYSWWSRAHRPYTVAELVADGIVHGLGLIGAIVAGSVLLALPFCKRRRKRPQPSSFTLAR